MGRTRSNQTLWLSSGAAATTQQHARTHRLVSICRATAACCSGGGGGLGSMSLREVEQHPCHMLHDDLHVLRQQHSLHTGTTLSRLPTCCAAAKCRAHAHLQFALHKRDCLLVLRWPGALGDRHLQAAGWRERHNGVALVSGRAAAGPVHACLHGRHQRGVTCLDGASCAGVTYSARLRLCSAVSGMALMVLGCPQVGMSLRAAGHMPAASGCCGLCTKAADSTYARTCMRNRCIRSRRRSRAICTGGTQKYSAPGLAGILCWVHVAAAGRSRLRCTARLSEQEEGEVVGGGAHRQAVCCSP